MTFSIEEQTEKTITEIPVEGNSASTIYIKETLSPVMEKVEICEDNGTFLLCTKETLNLISGDKIDEEERFTNVLRTMTNTKNPRELRILLEEMRQQAADDVADFAKYKEERAKAGLHIFENRPATPDTPIRVPIHRRIWRTIRSCFGKLRRRP